MSKSRKNKVIYYHIVEYVIDRKLIFASPYPDKAWAVFDLHKSRGERVQVRHATLAQL
jgi:hypothetical protein